MSNRSFLRRVSRRHQPARRLMFESLERRTLMAVNVTSILGLGEDTGSGNAADVAVDGAGNTYISGTIADGSIDFDPAATHADNADILDVSQGAGFVAKYAGDGSFQWARSLGAEPTALALDGAGNAFVAGNYTGTAQFGSIVLAPVGNNGYADQFVTKIDSSGSFVWAKGQGVANTDMTKGVAVDPTGRYVYLLAKTYVYIGPGYATQMMLTKFDAANPGNVLTPWSYNVSSSWNEVDPAAVALDAAGNVLATGEFRGTVDFDPSKAKLNLDSGGDKSGLSAFVWKLNSGGGLVWAKNFAGSSSSYSYGREIAADASGNVVVTGYFFGQPDFDPGKGRLTLSNAGGMDAFVVKLTSSGNLTWGRSFGGPGDDRAFDLVTDAAGNIFVSGNFSSGADFDPGPGAAVRSGSGAFVVKLNASGSFVWVATVNGSASAAGLAVSPVNGQVQLVGGFSGSVNTDPDPNPLMDELFGGDNDMFWLTLSES